MNGNFEASSDPSTTPTGWTSIGGQNGVLSYAATSTPAYDGLYYYDIGGFGTNGGAVYGQGISQAVATTIGTTYTLTFGYSDENAPGATTDLIVTIGGVSNTISLVSTAVDNNGYFQRPFTTTSYDYVATGALTTISFTIGNSNNYGNNDPMIDKVSFVAKATTSALPEPAAWSMMIGGFGMVGGALRRRTKVSARFA